MNFEIFFKNQSCVESNELKQMNTLNKKSYLLHGLGAIQCVLYIFLYFQGIGLQNNYRSFPFLLITICFIFIFYFFSLSFFKIKNENTSNKPLLLFSILFFAFLYRLICFFFPPLLSDDIFYYIWHGKVAAYGFNPYLYNPQSPELTFLRDSKIWELLPFKDIAPAYPPLVMITFWLAFKIGADSLLAFKALLWLPEIITCFFGIKLLKAYKKNPGWILIYAWCPLAIIEYIGMGHSDVWGIAFLTSFLYFFKKEKIAPAFIFLALATLIKWIPLLFLPFLWRKMTGRQRGLAILCFTLTIGLLYLPYLSAGKNVIGLLPTYLKSWEFNGSLYKLIRLCFERADVTHGVVSALAGLWALGVAWKNPPLEKGLLSITLAFFLFFHTVYPWYLGWLLPLLLVRKHKTYQPHSSGEGEAPQALQETTQAPMMVAAYAWLFTSFFSYWILIDYRTQNVWKENLWTLLLEYLPVFLLLFIQWRDRKSPPLLAEGTDSSTRGDSF